MFLAILITFLIVVLILWLVYKTCEFYEKVNEKEPNVKIVVIITTLLLAASLLIIWGYYISNINSEDYKLQQEVAKEQREELHRQTNMQLIVRSHLKDGSSARFKGQYGQCGFVNSKNSFGAYEGYIGFVVLSRDMILLDEYPTSNLYTAARKGMIEKGLCR
ncbi:hypothetical protein LMG33810_002816 [Carnimonas sp. LMG 33810]